MRVRVQIPVWVSAELRRQTVGDSVVYVVGTPVIDAGQYYETIDAPLLNGTKLYLDAVNAIVAEGSTYHDDMAAGSDHGIGTIGTEYKG